MAIYEHEGICPNNEFLRYSIQMQLSPNGRCALEMLGDRTGYMVYPYGQNAFEGWLYVVMLLCGDETLLPIKVAETLLEFIPDCQYGTVGRKIELRDVVNPLQMKDVHLDAEGNLMGVNGTVLHANHNFIVGIKDCGESVQMCIYRKLK